MTKAHTKRNLTTNVELPKIYLCMKHIFIYVGRKKISFLYLPTFAALHIYVCAYTLYSYIYLFLYCCHLYLLCAHIMYNIKPYMYTIIIINIMVTSQSIKLWSVMFIASFNHIQQTMRLCMVRHFYADIIRKKKARERIHIVMCSKKMEKNGI